MQLMTILDSLVVQRRGVPFRVDIRPDWFHRPQDFDDHRYTPADEANFGGSGWRFVCVCVTPVGHELCATEFSGIEFGESLRWQVTTADLIVRGDADGWFDEAHTNLVRGAKHGQS
jgi:hypothetical protein